MKPLLLAAVWLVFFAPQAQAYVDPGTGSLIIQSLLGLAVTAGLFFRQIKQSVLAAFARRSENVSEPHE